VLPYLDVSDQKGGAGPHAWGQPLAQEAAADSALVYDVSQA
jgi:hypothetical protein